MAGRRSSFQRTEARLWTGPFAHLIGGALDVLGALAGYGLARLKESAVGRRSMPASEREAGRHSMAPFHPEAGPRSEPASGAPAARLRR